MEIWFADGCTKARAEKETKGCLRQTVTSKAAGRDIGGRECGGNGCTPQSGAQEKKQLQGGKFN